MHELKSGCADAQLSAARLWAILLRNSSAAFIVQSTAVDFLETIEAVVVSHTTSPVVRNRLLHVLGDAVHSNPTQDGFRRLWMAIKPEDAPAQGFPYDAHDAILRSSGHRYRQNAIGILDRINPPAPQPRAVDTRFPYEWEAPPSYETATGTLDSFSDPGSPVVESYGSGFSDTASSISAYHSQDDLPPTSDGWDAQRLVQWSTTPTPPLRLPRLQITGPPSGQSTIERMIPIRDTALSTNAATLSTLRPTAIRLPFAQAQNRANSPVPIASSSRPAPVQAPYIAAHGSSKSIYANTLSYLRGAADSQAHSGYVDRNRASFLSWLG
ncbi:hypothetical protein B0H19DRAFT_241628 [Mycena capillaripes]|nr:hypothetical protein B0H19DRAFT_241628 [Mycena capillaripes]